MSWVESVEPVSGVLRVILVLPVPPEFAAPMLATFVVVMMLD